MLNSKPSLWDRFEQMKLCSVLHKSNSNHMNQVPPGALLRPVTDACEKRHRKQAAQALPSAVDPVGAGGRGTAVGVGKVSKLGASDILTWRGQGPLWP